MKKVLLFGPDTSLKKGAYGGGVGGYTRNMIVYLECFQNSEFALVPCVHTVRGEIKAGLLTPMVRILIDISRLLKKTCTKQYDAIHVLAQYRDAVIRELITIIIAKIFGLKVIYDIKAGAFITSYSNRGFLYKAMIRSVLAMSDLILVEGIKYIGFIEESFKKQSYFFPNFVLKNEIPEYRNKFHSDGCLKVLFVGYCFKDKGVFELLDGCILAHLNHIPIELTFAGQEHPDFTSYANKRMKEIPTISITRLGIVHHDRILQLMNKSNTYCYPTKHSGEGHNNSINEAMMFSLAIITTNQGFLSDILEKKDAYHLEEVSSEAIYKALKQIYFNPIEAEVKIINAYKKVKSEFSSEPLKKKLNKYYSEILEDFNATYPTPKV